jgi:hypothetical protein
VRRRCSFRLLRENRSGGESGILPALGEPAGPRALLREVSKAGVRGTKGNAIGNSFRSDCDALDGGAVPQKPGGEQDGEQVGSDPGHFEPHVADEAPGRAMSSHIGPQTKFI